MRMLKVLNIDASDTASAGFADMGETRTGTTVKYFFRTCFMKKTISVLLAIVICLSLLQSTALAADTITVSLDAGLGGSVTGGGQYPAGSTVTVTAIPDTGYIFDGWYESSYNGFILGNGVTTIGGGAFGRCPNLTDVTIGRSVTDIGQAAFYECGSLKSITIPGSVASIGLKAFALCEKLTTAVLEYGVASIGEHAFSYCESLTSITIPGSVTSISSVAFHNTPNLTIFGAAGSYAENYAREKNIPFVTITEQPREGLAATPTSSTVYVNGEAVAFDAYFIEGNNYFKLRDLAYILNGTEKQFSVDWDGAANAISLASRQPYIAIGGEMEGKGDGTKTPIPTNSKIFLDGLAVNLTAYNIDGNNYFKLRDIGTAFDFAVLWDGASNSIIIDTSRGYTPE